MSNLSGPLNFKQVISQYEKLLLANPGKALVIGGGGNVAVLEDGQVFGAAIGLDGTVEMDNLYDFDPRAFIEDEGCWDGESPEQSASNINNPVYIDTK